MSELLPDEQYLTVDQALAMLPPNSDFVHTFLGPFGADWRREDVETLIRETSTRRKTTGMAAAMGHHLALWMQEGKWLYVQAEEPKHVQ